MVVVRQSRRRWDDAYAEYVAAIAALDLGTPFVAETVYRENLVISGWFNRAK
jgi:uncharacterized membrane protein